MNLRDYLFENAVQNEVEVGSVEDAVDMLITLHKNAGNLTDAAACKKEMLQREATLPTVLEHGVALPHTKGAGVKKTALAVLHLKAPLTWGNTTVHTVCMLASTDDRRHIEALSSLAAALQNHTDEI